MSSDPAGPELRFEPGPDYWQVTCRGRYPELISALAGLMPPGLTLYVEGGSIAPVVRAYLEERPAAETPAVRRGTIWPRPSSYHMPMTPENVAGLVELMPRLAEPEVADHLHAYRGTTAYLIWYDALSRSPLYLRIDIQEADLEQVCRALDCEYSAFG